MRLHPFVMLLAAPLAAQSTAVVPFTAGMSITHSVRIRPGSYSAPAGDSAAITVRGSNLTVDLTGVELVGNPDRSHPDHFSGIAVRIVGGRHVTVKGLHARGYKVGIIARGVTRLSLLDNDLSYNWKPRLYSGVLKESLIDWLDYHQNDKDEWLRYGAGIYLVDVTIAEIKGNSVIQGMNGLLLTRTTGARIWNNTFSWNSGLGIGMYRASHNYIMHNRMDWNVRGYSHGFYNRGQDSAGLLIYEQSSNNVVAYNSATHSGDGLFLWAGQSTMNTGQGGCNDNLFYANDFSYAPTNAMEATFSRNRFVGNVATDSWHGFWGGYSYHSIVIGNHFARNVEAIAIEHGQDNQIVANTFDGDTVAIHAWWNAVEPSDWGYPRTRDTKSHLYAIDGNFFQRNRVALRFDNTQDVTVRGNRFTAVDTAVRVTGDSSGWTSSSEKIPTERALQYWVPPIPGAINAKLVPGARRGRSTIIIDEWGPYDWKSPKLWPAGRDDTLPLRLRVLGPPGQWSVAERSGVASLSAEGGRVGDVILVVPQAGRENDFVLTLVYRGGAVTTPFGVHIPAEQPVRFEWSRFVPAANWHVAFFPFDSARTPRTDAAAIDRALQLAPLAALDTNRLDLTWYEPPRKAIPQSSVLTEATTSVSLPAEPRRYVLRTIADDAVRVYLDGNLVIDDWTPGESHAAIVHLVLGGTHAIRVVHLQLTGWYELRLDISKDVDP